MNRRCMNCMNIFGIMEGYEAENNCCPFCGFVENTMPSNPSALPTGIVLNNRYSIGTVIGSGGFGITYKAWDNTFDCIVAIKEYFPKGLVARTETTTVSVYDGDEFDFNHGKARFLKEARNLAKLNKNPLVVSVQDYFEANGTAYMVMEYLNGCNLKEYAIKESPENKRLPLETVMNMSSFMCKVLSEIHSAGIIHRDISPDNIFLCDDGIYKLIDFGAAKVVSSESNLSTTVFLKRGFAPIEQYAKSGKIGPWTDIYALSATIYCLLTGEVPQDSLDRMDSDELVPLIKINNQVPKNFNDAIMKGLSVQVVGRYDRVEDFYEDLFRQDERTTTIKPPKIPPETIEIYPEEYQSSNNTASFLSKTFAVISILSVFLLVVLYGLFDNNTLGDVLTSIPVVFFIMLLDAFAFIKDSNLKGFEIPIGLSTVLGCAYSIVLSFNLTGSLFVICFIISLLITICSIFSFYWAFKRSKTLI